MSSIIWKSWNEMSNEARLCCILTWGTHESLECIFDSEKNRIKRAGVIFFCGKGEDYYRKRLLEHMNADLIDRHLNFRLK